MFKNWLKNVSMIAVAWCAFMGQAQATNYDFVFNMGAVATIVNRDADVLTNFEFNDVFELDLREPVSLSISVGEVEDDVYNIIDNTLSYGFYDSQNNFISTPVNLLPGLYQLRVSGTAYGFGGGQYFVNAFTTPVPEADAALMMLVGLMMMSLVSIRKYSV